MQGFLVRGEPLITISRHANATSTPTYTSITVAG